MAVDTGTRLDQIVEVDEDEMLFSVVNWAYFHGPVVVVEQRLSFGPAC